MRLTKNMYEGMLNNLGFRKDKAEDPLKTRMDLEEMNIRPILIEVSWALKLLV